MEKAVKASVDALWARFQEENTKHEKAERERIPRQTALPETVWTRIWNAWEGIEEGNLFCRASSSSSSHPIIEKSISSAIADSLQVLLLAQAFLSTWDLHIPGRFSDCFFCREVFGARQ